MLKSILVESWFLTNSNWGNFIVHSIIIYYIPAITITSEVLLLGSRSSSPKITRNVENRGTISRSLRGDHRNIWRRRTSSDRSTQGRPNLDLSLQGGPHRSVSARTRYVRGSPRRRRSEDQDDIIWRSEPWCLDQCIFGQRHMELVI